MVGSLIKPNPNSRKSLIGVSKKIEKPRKSKKKLKKPNHEKNRLKWLKFKKIDQFGSFWFYKPETEKTKPNQTQTEKKLSQNRAKTEKLSQIGLDRFLF
jgi:hypothetical protein